MVLSGPLIISYPERTRSKKRRTLCQVPGFPPQVADYRPLLGEAGFAVEAYEEAHEWERRQRGVYAGILAATEALIQERGEQAAGFMIQEAEHATGLADGTDYLAHARRIFVVARRS